MIKEKQLRPHTVKQLLKVLKNCSRHLEQSYQQIGSNSLWHAAIEAEDAYDFLLGDLYSKRATSRVSSSNYY